MDIPVRRTDPLRGLTDDGWIALDKAGVKIPEWMRYMAYEPLEAERDALEIVSNEFSRQIVTLTLERDALKKDRDNWIKAFHEIELIQEGSDRDIAMLQADFQALLQEIIRLRVENAELRSGA